MVYVSLSLGLCSCTGYGGRKMKEVSKSSSDGVGRRQGRGDIRKASQKRWWNKLHVKGK